MFVTLVKPCANTVSLALPAATLPPMAVRRIPGLKTGSSNRWTLIVAAVASVLLVTLAVLQYRWTGELSAAANERMRANLEESSRLLAGDIETPLAQLYTALLRVATLTEPGRAPTAGQPAQFEELLARVVRDWRRNAAFPHILDETWLVLTDRREGTRNAFRLDEDSGRLEPGGAPADLEEAVRALRPPGRLTPTQRTDLLVIPLPTRIRSGRPGLPTSLIAARVDVSVLEQEMLPAMIERHFGAVSPGEEPPYRVSVTDVSGPAPRQVFPDPAGAPGRTSTIPSGAADIQFRVLRTRPFRERQGDRDRPGFRPNDRDDRRRFSLAERERRDGGRDRDRSAGAWQVRITHRSGSLEAATSAARRRNLYVSSGVLTLIAVGFGLVLVSARRAQSLAAQQVDFVAGVSHELNTPLQAIRSAGENLRAGIVHRPDDVRGYGEMIEREGRRLSRLVAQALQWAGIGRASARNATAEIDPGELLRTTVAESTWFLEENGVELEVEGLDDLPSIPGDRDALITAFMNLLHNAAKYGRDADGAVRVRVDASSDAARRRVTVAVTDRGPGIPKAEQRRIFDPFVRGRTATEGTQPGSGLGLSLARNTIEEHGGSITVDSEPGRTTFSVSLPANSE